MQNRYAGDISDFLKLAILRTLSPGYRLGVAWWLYPDETGNEDSRRIGCLGQPEQWRHFGPQLFDTLGEIVSSGRRNVRALESANVLTGAMFASEVIPVNDPISGRPLLRQEWLEAVQAAIKEADIVFLDPDGGLERVGQKHRSTSVGRNILPKELCAFARPGRCVIFGDHQRHRVDGGHRAIGYWVSRLHELGIATVDALWARPYSSRMFFLLNAPTDVRQRAEEIESRWHRLVTWHPNGERSSPRSRRRPTRVPAGVRQVLPDTLVEDCPRLSSEVRGLDRTTIGSPTQVGYVNRNEQEVVRRTIKLGNSYGQFIYVLRCQACGHEYGTSGSDINQRRCPVHDGGMLGLPF
jgi:hypothetical protein